MNILVLDQYIKSTYPLLKKWSKIAIPLEAVGFDTTFAIPLEAVGQSVGLIPI